MSVNGIIGGGFFAEGWKLPPVSFWSGAPPVLR